MGRPEVGAGCRGVVDAVMGVHRVVMGCSWEVHVICVVRGASASSRWGAVVCPRGVRGMSIGGPSTRGMSVECLWSTHGLAIEHAWVVLGQPVGCPWVGLGCLWDVHGARLGRSRAMGTQ